MAEPATDPMPVFVIKAKDNNAAPPIGRYIDDLRSRGMYGQAEEAQEALDEINAWRHRNPALCKWPDHKHVPAGQPGSESEA